MDTDAIVYVVSPEPELPRSLAALLSLYGIGLMRFDNAESFLATTRGREEHNSSLLLEVKENDPAGLAAIHHIRQQREDLPIIAVGDDAPADMGQQAREAGATEFIEKALAWAYLHHRLAELTPGKDGLPQIEPAVLELSGGERVTLRMSRPEDADLFQEFISSLSDESRYLRFFSGLKKLPAKVLKVFTTPCFPHSFAVGAFSSEGDQQRQIGVARWAPTETPGVGEFAMVVADDYQGQGIGSQLMRLLITAATLGQLERLEGLILRENAPMLSIVEHMGFENSPQHDSGPTIARYVKELHKSAA